MFLLHLDSYVTDVQQGLKCLLTSGVSYGRSFTEMKRLAQNLTLEFN